MTLTKKAPTKKTTVKKAARPKVKATKWSSKNGKFATVKDFVAEKFAEKGDRYTFERMAKDLETNFPTRNPLTKSYYAYLKCKNLSVDE